MLLSCWPRFSGPTSVWRPAATGNVKGFADISKDEDDSDDDDEGNEYYAGGEKSGQVNSHFLTPHSVHYDCIVLVYAN